MSATIDRALYKTQLKMTMTQRVLNAFFNKENGNATEDDLIIIKLANKKSITVNELRGVVVMKEFEDGWYKGWVMEHDEHGFLVEYEDGDSEHLSAEEIEEVRYVDNHITTLCDMIENLEASGCKAQTFSKLCKDMIDGRPRLAKELAYIYMEMGHVNIKLDDEDEDDEEFTIDDISPHLWTFLGDTELDKLYYAKRILESLNYIARA